jgi:NADPH-dependent 2,4-dienoyl-CoA reductase/sulfur reductase-like enzyme
LRIALALLLVPGLATATPATAAPAAAARVVESPARSVPIIDRVDLVVVGSNEGGLAAAWKAAKLGARVVLLSENTFLGSEVTAKGRYQLAGPAPTREFSRRLFADMTPSSYRVATDKLLRGAGVVYLNNTRPAGVLVDATGQLAGVVTANKAGLQAVVAKVVIDATYTGAVADAAGAERLPWNVQTLTASRTSTHAKTKVATETVKDVPMASLSWPLINQAEKRLRGTEVAQVGPAFAHSIHFTIPNPIIARTAFNGAAFPGADQLDLGVCQPRTVGRLLVIGAACNVGRQAVQTLLQPVVLAEVGERLGEYAFHLAARLTAPAEVTVKVPVAHGVKAAGLAIHELNERERPFKKAALETVAQPPIGIPVWAEYDVVVVGSGPAGHSAAIAAARAGARTLMLEMGGFIGGNVSLGVTGFWRGYRRGFNQEWTKKGYPQLLQEAGVDIWYHSMAMGAVKRGSTVAGVEIATWLGRGVVLGRIVIDASGDGDVCAAAGAKYRYLNDGDLNLQEASFKDIGLYSNVAPVDPIDIAGTTLQHALAPLAASKLPWDFKPMIQIRETRLIQGDHVVDELDINAGRTYCDVIGIALSAFDPHGYYGSDYSFAGLMPSTKHVKESVTCYIPLRSIMPAGLENIFMVGRCHSMTHDAQAMIRMNPDVINEGYAAGYAAALCVKHGTTPRQVDLKALQDHLFAVDILPTEDRKRILQEMLAPSGADLVAAAAAPGSRPHLLTLARGGTRSLAPLRQAFEREPTTAGARALCLLGDSTGVPALAGWVEAQPLGRGPAYDWEGFLKVPEIDGAIWLLGIPKDNRAVPALLRKLAECRADTGFNKLRAVTMALGRIGDPAAARPLAEFLRRPGIQGHANSGNDPATIRAEYFSRAMIELFAASALQRCGDADGLGRQILTGYLGDWRGIFVRFAGQVLAESGGGEPTARR